jgi:hypothetical protein
MINSRHCEERSDEAIQSSYSVTVMDCFAELVIGRHFAPTRWLAMTERTTAIIARVMQQMTKETP